MHKQKYMFLILEAKLFYNKKTVASKIIFYSFSDELRHWKRQSQTTAKNIFYLSMTLIKDIFLTAIPYFFYSKYFFNSKLMNIVKEVCHGM